MCGKSCRRCRLFSAPVRALKQLSILYSTEGRESSMISLVRMLQHLTVEFLKAAHYSVSWCDKVVPVSITNARSMPTARVSDSGIWWPLSTRLWRYLRRLLFPCCDGLSWSCCQNLPCKQWHGCSMQSLPCWLWVHLFPSCITFFLFVALSLTWLFWCLLWMRCGIRLLFADRSANEQLCKCRLCIAHAAVPTVDPECCDTWALCWIHRSDLFVTRNSQNPWGKTARLTSISTTYTADMQDVQNIDSKTAL